MINETDRTKKAILLAEFAHTGQFYGSSPYIHHLSGVEALALPAPDVNDLGVEYVRQVSYLHDILEDTLITEGFLREHFSKEVVEAVVLLTKKEWLPYDDYIDNIKKNRLALVVKVADTLYNLHQSVMNKHEKRIKKYTAQLTNLVS